MLNTDFPKNQSVSSREKDFLKILTIYGHGGHLGHVTKKPRNFFSFPLPIEVSHKIQL